MPLGTANSKTFTITYFWLEAPADIMDCLVQLLDIDCHGTISATKINNAPSYTMNITGAPLGTSTLTCTLNDVLLWDGSVLRKTDYMTFTNQFTTA